MTYDYVESTLTRLQAHAEQVEQAATEGDSEEAHIGEDGLFRVALGRIADAPPGVSERDLRRIARAGLATVEMTFERWCA